MKQTYLLTSGPNENSNQPAHPRSLIRVFVVLVERLCILGYPKCASRGILIRVCKGAGWSESSLNILIYAVFSNDGICNKFIALIVRQNLLYTSST